MPLLVCYPFKYCNISSLQAKISYIETEKAVYKFQMNYQKTNKVYTSEANHPAKIYAWMDQSNFFIFYFFIDNEKFY